jgi:hypothetical protein
MQKIRRKVAHGVTEFAAEHSSRAIYKNNS